ncbi:MAG: lmo0937 family membrane protein [Gemmatimonadales bacterium]|nr:MAG: lmo0937 family membrane protein [Gemmatimonadales bacterium]
MLFTIAIVLFVLWALGLFSGYAMGGLIHLFLVIAMIVLLMQFMAGRRTA